ncbi:hypothetical protein L6R29_05250 [Myxococcota bacterium]|nr:hypothetical protein [Myxococcota bacterium]
MIFPSFCRPPYHTLTLNLKPRLRAMAKSRQPLWTQKKRRQKTVNRCGRKKGDGKKPSTVVDAKKAMAKTRQPLRTQKRRWQKPVNRCGRKKGDGKNPSTVVDEKKRWQNPVNRGGRKDLCRCDVIRAGLLLSVSGLASIDIAQACDPKNHQGEFAALYHNGSRSSCVEL